MKKLFYNPFGNYPEQTLILIGSLAAVAGGLLAWCFNARFDGAIDLHFVPQVLPYEPFLDLLIDIVSVVLLLFSLGKYINAKTRLADILAAVTISRIPLYILPLFNANNAINEVTDKMMVLKDPQNLNIEPLDMFVLLAFALVSILFLIWSFVLLFNGFKTATNAKGASHTVLFIIAILLAEILSKTLLSLL